MKPLLSIEEQIARLIENKNVKVNSQIEKEKFKSYLLKYNYINVIGSTKLLFATGYDIKKKEHIYEKATNCKDIMNLHDKFLKFECILREGIFDYESQLKVMLSLYLRDLFDKKQIGFEEFIKSIKSKDNKKIFNNKEEEKYTEYWYRNITKYSEKHKNKMYSNYYTLIKILSFGTIVRIFLATYEGKHILSQVQNFIIKENISFKIFNDLSTISILRNVLCHKEPILIFLNKGLLKDNIHNNGKDVYNKRVTCIEKIYCEYLGYQLPRDSIIKQFSNLKCNRTDKFPENIII